MRFTLEELCERVGGRLDGPPDTEVTGVGGIQEALPGQITFLARDRYRTHLESTRAAAVLLPDDVPCPLPAIRVDDPYLAFLFVLRGFARPATDFFAPGVDARAVIHPEAELGADVRIGPGAVVDRGCRVGDRTILGAGTVLMPESQVGADSLLYPNVTVREDCAVGDRCILHPGVVVGSDGFGFTPFEGALQKIPQIGRVVLEDDVEIGANTCIDRATTGVTRIRRGTKLDNLVQIAHNVVVGEHTVISSQTGISGSATVGSGVTLAGQVGVAGHLEIGDRVTVGGQSGITGDVPPGETVSGTPARDHREWRRLSVHLGRLPRYADELTDLRRRVAALEGNKDASTPEND